MIDKIPDFSQRTSQEQEAAREIVIHEETLANSSIELNTPLYKEGKAPEKFSYIQGDILGLLKLPGNENEPDKILAVVDYGDDFKNKRLFSTAPGLGRPNTRYAIRGINYSPTSHLSPHAGINKRKITIGRDDDKNNPQKDPASRDLGLDETGNEAISRSHLTLELTDQGVKVTDHSTNHTGVIYAQEADGNDINKDLGRHTKMLGSLAANLR